MALKCVFWIAAAVIVYAYVGYVCWLRLQLLWRKLPVQRAAVTPTVSVVMVVRNEEQVLESKLQNLLGLDYPGLEIVVVSDGSTDRTESILREYAREARVVPVLKQESRGKAAGLNDALQRAQGEIVVFTDARQKIEPQALRLLAENFADPDVGCVSGELMLGDPSSGESREGLGLYWRIEKMVRELESASGSVMGATGALYAARRELLTAVPMGTILDDVYLPMQVVRQGKRVILDGRAKAWDQANLGTEREFGRKVRTLSGNYQLVQLAPWLLTSENPARFRFVSHKLMRLVSPFALAAMLSASFLLPQPLYRLALIAQLLFYGLSLMAVWSLALGPLRRLADAAHTFVILNVAALVAFSNFVRGREVSWTR